MNSKLTTEMLDEAIREYDVDAYLRFDDSASVDHRYVTGFEAGDSFGYLRDDGESILLVAPLEKGRARAESNADTVRSTGEFVSGDVRDDVEAEANVLSAFLEEYDVTDVGVPQEFDLYYAERLEEAGFTVRTIGGVVMNSRIQKTERELESLRAAQTATEQSMEYAAKTLAESDIVDGTLYYEGEVLTAEWLRAELRAFLGEHDCRLDDAIVACGTASADPHESGSGPLRANQPIILDIFPQHSSGYWGDMTRTFVRGTPEPELEAMYRATEEALDAALEVLSTGAGVTGAAVHDAVCDVYEAAGYPTIRQGDIEEGFLHSTGHATGLELHEPPRLVDGTGELAAGTVLTVEPGLYDSDVGGVRIEDMVVVTSDGYRNLNDSHSELVL